jgi:5-(hydroxymethyl)furfural/furfural oxidase
MDDSRSHQHAVDLNGAQFDVIIVGAGAAGCILAARLSEDPYRKVALIEAGEDMPPGTEPRDVLDPLPVASSLPGLSWSGLTADITVQRSKASRQRTKKFTQGFGVGGGSTICGSFAFRGQPEDYDEWAASGAAGWSWQHVLPYFRKLETDLDVAGDMHGSDGPMMIRREARGNWAPFSEYLAAALMQEGYSWLNDYNGEFQDGCASPPMANLPDRRIPTSVAYLTREVRQRPNLMILSNVEAHELLFEGKRVIGIRISRQDGETRILGTEVVLSCGGIFTPVLLQRSGIGPAARLHALGIEPRIDLPGVGEQLKNHPNIYVAFHLPDRSRQRDDVRAIGQVCARYSSKRPGCKPHDMGMSAINRTTWHALGRQIGALMIALYQPRSVGHVRLTGPRGRPEDVDIQFSLLDDELDFARMCDGLAFGLRLLAGAQSRGIINTVFMPNTKQVDILQPHNKVNAIAAEVIRLMFSSNVFRQVALGRGVLDLADVIGSPEKQAEIIRLHANVSHHVCCSCRMGAADDLSTVVTSGCRVRGTEGLRIVDASIFPDIPRAGMFVPVMMAAEKMADEIAQRR